MSCLATVKKVRELVGQVMNNPKEYEIMLARLRKMSTEGRKEWVEQTASHNPTDFLGVIWYSVSNKRNLDVVKSLLDMILSFDKRNDEYMGTFLLDHVRQAIFFVLPPEIAGYYINDYYIEMLIFNSFLSDEQREQCKKLLISFVQNKLKDKEGNKYGNILAYQNVVDALPHDLLLKLCLVNPEYASLFFEKLPTPVRDELLKSDKFKCYVNPTESKRPERYKKR